MRKVSILPSLFTLGNLLSGLGSIWYAAKALALVQGAEVTGRVTSWEEAMKIAAWLIFLGMLFDALDGRIARMTDSTSQFGKELDSIADFATFGIAPAFLIEVFSFNDKAILYVIHDRGRMLLSAAYAVFAALRLARYNVQASRKGLPTRTFKGIPSPAAAGLLASLVLVFMRGAPPDYAFLLDQLRHWAPLAAALMGVLMVSGVPFPHIGNRFLASGLSYRRMVFAAFVALGFFMFPEYVLFSLLVSYVLVSLAMGLRRRSDALPSGGAGGSEAEG